MEPSYESHDGHVTKRQRTDSDGHAIQAGLTDRFDDPHKQPPSCVVHLRGLGECIIQQDLWDALDRFGKVGYVMVMQKKRQALVEFEVLEDAVNCVKYAQTSPVYIGGQQAYFNFSTSQHIQRPPDSEERTPHYAGNHILWFTILEPIHPITVDVMKTICTPYGKVLRIVVFRKTGVQSMVEFDSVESAKKARTALNGADIYTNCCTLKIEFAKPTRLNVKKNDNNESWDYTLDGSSLPYSPTAYNYGAGGEDAPYNGYSGGRAGYGAAGGSGGGRHDYEGHDYSEYPPRQDSYPTQEYSSDLYSSRFDSRGRGGSVLGYDRKTPVMPDPVYGSGGGPGLGGGMNKGAVLMVYGLNMEKMNCQRLFNLLCLYGNVVRIKFLMKKEGSAMVQMGDPLAVERAIQNLNNITFYNNKMQVSKSIQPSVQEVPNPHDLPDGNPSYTDYSLSRNNRYTSAKSAGKNRIQMPTTVLHYFNAPPNMTEEDLEELFTSLEVEPPQKVKQFPSKSERSSSGLLVWSKPSEAVEALIVANHYEVKNPSGKGPFIFKLCFSSNFNID